MWKYGFSKVFLANGKFPLATITHFRQIFVFCINIFKCNLKKMYIWQTGSTKHISQRIRFVPRLYSSAKKIETLLWHRAGHPRHLTIGKNFTNPIFPHPSNQHLIIYRKRHCYDAIKVSFSKHAKFSCHQIQSHQLQFQELNFRNGLNTTSGNNFPVSFLLWLIGSWTGVDKIRAVVHSRSVRNQGQIGPKVTRTTDARNTLQMPLTIIISTGRSILLWQSKPRSLTESVPRWPTCCSKFPCAKHSFIEGRSENAARLKPARKCEKGCRALFLNLKN